MIYLLEDDDSIRKLVVYALKSQDFEAEGFDRPSAFWPAVNAAVPSLILLDLMLAWTPGQTITSLSLLALWSCWHVFEQ